MKTFDISPELSARTAVFPGDQPFSRSVAMDIANGDHLTLSAITSTLHIGAHVDAPSHYAPGAAAIAERPLDYYLGRAQVIEVRKAPHSRIVPADLGAHQILAPRVLFKTRSFENPEACNGDFVACSAELIEHLARHGVRLVGIDTPSIDPADDKILESHAAVARHDMAILEGILLTEVPEGVYTLIALPLKIKDADASPVRAVLLEKDLGIA